MIPTSLHAKTTTHTVGYLFVIVCIIATMAAGIAVADTTEKGVIVAYYIWPEKSECWHGLNGIVLAYRISKDDCLMAPIEGFDFEPGTEYVIEVRRTAIPAFEQQSEAPEHTYELVRIVWKRKR